MSTEKEGDGSGKGGPFGGIRVFLWAPVTSFPGQNTHNTLMPIGQVLRFQTRRGPELSRGCA